MNDGFISKLIQYAAGFLTLTGIVLQYFLRNEFFQILKFDITNSYYNAFTLAGLILGLVVFIGVFANRYFINSRFHFNRKGYNKYLKSIRNTSKEIREEKTKREESDDSEGVIEPLYLDGVRISYISLLLSISSFVLIFCFSNPLLRSIFYLVFLLTIIFSATIFIMQLYMSEDWKRQEKERINLVITKIKDYFAPPIKIFHILEDRSNFLYQTVNLIIKVDDKIYRVNADINNPNKFFSIYEISQQDLTKNDKKQNKI